mmetsp:Transcript_22150/g.68513  ORF Transcript_22150/g.68513 Transcript_22150/m.68513 type:complete len:493 (-) Transcript_22150:429-1907(-)
MQMVMVRLLLVRVGLLALRAEHALEPPEHAALLLHLRCRGDSAAGYVRLFHWHLNVLLLLLLRRRQRVSLSLLRDGRLLALGELAEAVVRINGWVVQHIVRAVGEAPRHVQLGGEDGHKCYEVVHCVLVAHAHVRSHAKWHEVLLEAQVLTACLTESLWVKLLGLCKALHRCRVQRWHDQRALAHSEAAAALALQRDVLLGNLWHHGGRWAEAQNLFDHLPGVGHARDAIVGQRCAAREQRRRLGAHLSGHLGASSHVRDRPSQTGGARVLRGEEEVHDAVGHRVDRGVRRARQVLRLGLGHVGHDARDPQVEQALRLLARRVRLKGGARAAAQHAQDTVAATPAAPERCARQEDRQRQEGLDHCHEREIESGHVLRAQPRPEENGLRGLEVHVATQLTCLDLGALALGALRHPACQVALDDVLLQRQVHAQRALGEERQEARAQRLVLGAVQEGDVVPAQDDVRVRVQHHPEAAPVRAPQHLVDHARVGHE